MKSEIYLWLALALIVLSCIFGQRTEASECSLEVGVMTLCAEEPRPQAMKMRCSRWSEIVKAVHKIGGGPRYRAVLLNNIKGLHRDHQRYVLTFSELAIQFHADNSDQFENPDHAFVAAMLFCGAYTPA